MKAMPKSGDIVSELTGQPPQQNPQLRVIEGGVVLGRVTSTRIDESDFEGTSAILNMSAAKVPKLVVHKLVDHHRVEVVAKEHRDVTTPPEIVKFVLSKTHRDLGAVMLGALLNQVDDEYESFDSEVQANGINVIAQATAEQSAQFASTDLLRGMDAFTYATQEQWGMLYDYTVLRPAQAFAQWLIVLESKTPHA